jgi:hypothetical protein
MSGEMDPRGGVFNGETADFSAGSFRDTSGITR